MINILFVHHGRGIGGASINLLNIIDNFDRSRFYPSVLLIHDSNLRQELEARKIPTFVAKSKFYRKFYRCYTHSLAFLDEWYRIDLWLRSSISWILSWIYFSKKELNRINFDIVHLNSSVLTDWLCSCKSLHDKKVVLHVQEPFSYGNFKIRYRFFRSQMNKYADAIVAISKDNSIRINLPEKVFIVHNFVNDVNEEEFICKKNHSGRILYLGGDNEIKGFFDVVDALDHIDDGLKIIFCGNFLSFNNCFGNRSSLKMIIWSLFKKNKKLINAHVKIRNHPKAEIFGFLPNSSNIFMDSDFLISPFTKPHFSRPIIEAFAHKKTAIGTSVEGMDEIIDHEVNGILVSPGDGKQLALAINMLSKNFGFREQLEINSYNKAKALYGLHNIKILEDIYLKLIGKNYLLVK